MRARTETYEKVIGGEQIKREISRAQQHDGMSEVTEWKGESGGKAVHLCCATTTNAPEAEVIEQGTLVSVDYSAVGVLCFRKKEEKED